VIRLGVRFYSEVHKSTLVMHYFKFNFELEGIILNTSDTSAVPRNPIQLSNKIFIEMRNLESI